ncbi:MAG: PAS domain S-box protein [Methanosarcina sp.]|nr:PAS domain S-box protein [Methanosarcina sp.]
MSEKLRMSGNYIIGDQRVEESLNQNELQINLNLENILPPAHETANLELAEIIDARAIQSFMEDFYKLAHIPIGIIDLKGNVLVGVGWQDVCTRFHRVHPESCKHCVESDTELSRGVAPGEFKLYKCKNNMWDTATPIIVDGQHVGNIFLGQFFFEDEHPDYELFRSQARHYGFNEEEYIAALEKVPRLSKETLNTIMVFFMKLASMISQLGYSNVRLSQSLAERDILVNSLRESEEKYRSVVETANEGIWIIDAEDRTIYVNQKMAEMLGYTQNEMIGRSGWDFTDEIDNTVPGLNRKKRQQGIDESHEFKFICKDGSPLWALVNTKSFFDRDGKFAGSMGMLTNITERKKAEEALIRSENKFRTLAENSPDVIARFDRQKRYAYINPAGSASGYSPEEIIGKNSSELGIDPDIVKLWEEHIENVFITGKPEEMEYGYKSPQGKEYYFSTKIVPEFSEGKVISALAISRDITDIKKVEEKLKETLNDSEKLVKTRTQELEKAYNSLKESEKGLAEAQKMAHIGNWEWDIAADKAYWPDEMYRIFGRDPKKEAPSYNEYLSYIHPDDRDYFDNAARKAVSGKPYSIEYRIILPDGEERIIHMQSQVIFNENNTPIRIKGTIQDITERKKAEKFLVNLEIARKKEIHHRIKNNLQVISSLLDLQAEKFSNRKYVKDSDVLNAFRESQDRIMSIALIHEELHEGGGNNTLYFSPYLEKLVESLFQTYSLGNADISLKIDLEDNIFFDMDTAVPLGIIVNEIVSNSLKHAFKGRNKGEIRIKLHKEERTGEENSRNEPGRNGEQKGTGYTLIVSDDGTGIPEDIGLENSDTLGLQLVSILVDQLNGEIELKRDKGTEFIIRISLQQSSHKPLAGRAEMEVSDTSF